MTVSKQARRAAMQLYRSCLADGTLDEQRAREAVRQLVTTKRRGYVGILSHLRRLLKLDQTKHTAVVESARTLPPELQSSVKTTLARLTGRGLRVTFAENAALVGGMRIQVGSDVYDGSVRARLSALEQNIG